MSPEPSDSAYIQECKCAAVVMVAVTMHACCSKVPTVILSHILLFNAFYVCTYCNTLTLVVTIPGAILLLDLLASCHLHDSGSISRGE